MNDLDVPALRQARDVKNLIYWKAETQIRIMEELPDDDDDEVGIKSGWLNREMNRFEKLRTYFVTFDRSKKSSNIVEPNQEVTDTSGPDEAELAFWNSVKDSDGLAEYQAYLEVYPEGHFAPIARIRVDKS